MISIVKIINKNITKWKLPKEYVQNESMAKNILICLSDKLNKSSDRKREESERERERKKKQQKQKQILWLHNN